MPQSVGECENFEGPGYPPLADTPGARRYPPKADTRLHASRAQSRGAGADGGRRARTHSAGHFMKGPGGFTGIFGVDDKRQGVGLRKIRDWDDMACGKPVKGVGAEFGATSEVKSDERHVEDVVAQAGARGVGRVQIARE